MVRMYYRILYHCYRTPIFPFYMLKNPSNDPILEGSFEYDFPRLNFFMDCGDAVLSESLYERRYRYKNRILGRNQRSQEPSIVQ